VYRRYASWDEEELELEEEELLEDGELLELELELELDVELELGTRPNTCPSFTISLSLPLHDAGLDRAQVSDFPGSLPTLRLFHTQRVKSHLKYLCYHGYPGSLPGIVTHVPCPGMLVYTSNDTRAPPESVMNDLAILLTRRT